MQWKGPYVTERKVGPLDYVVNDKGKSKVFHVNLLKRYYSRIHEADQKRDIPDKGGAVLEMVASASQTRVAPIQNRPPRVWDGTASSQYIVVGPRTSISV